MSVSIRLATRDQALGVIQNRLDSREWWLIVMASPHGNEMGSVIEEAYYKGEANADFELQMMPRVPGGPVIWALAMARKSRMSTRQLADLCGVDVGERDVIGTPDTPMAVLLWLNENLRGNT